MKIILNPKDIFEEGDEVYCYSLKFSDFAWQKVELYNPFIIGKTIKDALARREVKAGDVITVSCQPSDIPEGSVFRKRKDLWFSHLTPDYIFEDVITFKEDDGKTVNWEELAKDYEMKFKGEETWRPVYKTELLKIDKSK